MLEVLASLVPSVAGTEKTCVYRGLISQLVRMLECEQWTVDGGEDQMMQTWFASSAGRVCTEKQSWKTDEVRLLRF